MVRRRSILITQRDRSDERAITIAVSYPGDRRHIIKSSNWISALTQLLTHLIQFEDSSKYPNEYQLAISDWELD